MNFWRWRVSLIRFRWCKTSLSIVDFSQRRSPIQEGMHVRVRVVGMQFWRLRRRSIGAGHDPMEIIPGSLSRNGSPLGRSVNNGLYDSLYKTSSTLPSLVDVVKDTSVLARIFTRTAG